MDFFIILKLSANDFQVRTKEKNNNITRNSSRSDILTPFTMGSKKVPPNSFSLATSSNVGISPQNALTFSFNPFSILM